MPNEYFEDNLGTAYVGYKAWEARGRQLGYEGPHRLAISAVEWQFVGPSGTVGIYNAATGRGFVWVPPDNPGVSKP